MFTKTEAYAKNKNIQKKERVRNGSLFLRAYMEEAKLLKKNSSDILFKIKKKGGTYYGRVYNTYI